MELPIERNLIALSKKRYKCGKGYRYFKDRRSEDISIILLRKCALCKHYYPLTTYGVHSKFCIGIASPLSSVSPPENDSDSDPDSVSYPETGPEEEEEEEGEEKEEEKEQYPNKKPVSDQELEIDPIYLKQGLEIDTNEQLMDPRIPRYNTKFSCEIAKERHSNKKQKPTAYNFGPEKKEPLNRQEILKTLGPEYETTLPLLTDDEIIQNFGDQIFKPKHVFSTPSPFISKSQSKSTSNWDWDTDHRSKKHVSFFGVPDFKPNSTYHNPVDLTSRRTSGSKFGEKWDIGIKFEDPMMGIKNSKTEHSDLEEKYKKVMREMEGIPMVHGLKNLIDILVESYWEENAKDGTTVRPMIFSSYVDYVIQLGIPISRIVSNLKETKNPGPLIYDLVLFYLVNYGPTLSEDATLDVLEMCISEKFEKLRIEIEKKLFERYSIVSLFFSSRKYLKVNRKIMDILSTMVLYEISELADFQNLSNFKKDELMKTCVSYNASK